MAPDKTNNPKSTHNEPLPILFELRRRLWILLMIVLVVCVIGVAGYRIIEKVTWLEALYMTICVVSTLGLAIHPQTSLGTAFSILLAIVGISAAFYGVGAIIQIMVSREFQRARLQGKVWRKMEKMSNHMIIVGYGRIGRRIAQTMRFNPRADSEINAGDQLIMVSRESDLRRFEAFLGAGAA